jgi:hypothetical protein
MSQCSKALKVYKQCPCMRIVESKKSELQAYARIDTSLQLDVVDHFPVVQRAVVQRGLRGISESSFVSNQASVWSRLWLTAE